MQTFDEKYACGMFSTLLCCCETDCCFQNQSIMLIIYTCATFCNAPDPDFPAGKQCRMVEFSCVYLCQKISRTVKSLAVFSRSLLYSGSLLPRITPFCREAGNVNSACFVKLSQKKWFSSGIFHFCYKIQDGICNVDVRNSVSTE